MGPIPVATEREGQPKRTGSFRALVPLLLLLSDWPMLSTCSSLGMGFHGTFLMVQMLFGIAEDQWQEFKMCRKSGLKYVFISMTTQVMITLNQCLPDTTGYELGLFSRQGRCGRSEVQLTKSGHNEACRLRGWREP